MSLDGHNYPFHRPVIVLAAPRSGSTLLFESLALSRDLCTIGGESHGVFENISRFNPLKGQCDSNALYAEDATTDIVNQIRRSFYQQLQDSSGRRIQDIEPSASTPRLLEKTPKNALRVSLLNRIFPDALFIYLYRNPRENISSIMDAWRSGRFITYRKLPGRNKPWSMLLPPGWQSFHDAPLEEIAAFQWRSANTAILSELAKLGQDRWIGVSYGQQVHAPDETIKRICHFCQISSDTIIQSLSGGQTKLSRYTLTAPAADKWHKNAQALARVIPGLSDTIAYIKKTVPALPEDEFDLSVISNGSNSEMTDGVNWEPVGRRNSPCPCGSGQRFKHCHGNRSKNEREK